MARFTANNFVANNLAENNFAESHPLYQPLLDALETMGLVDDVTGLRLMPDTGLAHSHVWLARTNGDDWVARIPKQSQMKLAAHDNLHYQATCFRRAAASGHTPQLHTVLPPSEGVRQNQTIDLSLGGFLVSAIKGRAPELPKEISAIAVALANIHALPVPNEIEKAPLFAPTNPWNAMISELNAQANYLDHALISQAVRIKIKQELVSLTEWYTTATPEPSCLISFDAHPGNFLIQDDGRAILVDLEKCRYSLPGFDLAHASLYTSTTWDPTTSAELSLEEVRQFYQAWYQVMNERHIHCNEDNILQCRRAMWLWSITWCAKWLSTHNQNKDHIVGENWSSELSDASLISHVENRVTHYLSETIVTQVCEEWAQLKRVGIFT